MVPAGFDLDAYRRDGYAIVRGMFPTDVVRAVASAVGDDAIAVVDSAGNRQELNVWTDCGDDLLGRLPRSQSLVDIAKACVGDEVSHWHSKISWKRPGSVGTWDWHSDWGFWRDEACAAPAMTTVSIALDRQTTDNGCLRVIPRSHYSPDIDHGPVGESRAADPERVGDLIAEHGIVDLQLEPGDLVAFDCRTLHASGPNTTAATRSILHCSYNSASNPPTRPAYPGHAVHPLHVVDDQALAVGEWTHVHRDTPLLGAGGSYTGVYGYTVEDVADPTGV